MTNRKLQILALALLVAGTATAQEESPKGYLTGSFETNTNYYVDDTYYIKPGSSTVSGEDEKVGAFAPEDHFGSNNYLKLDYYRGKLAVGAQLEAYLPALQSYPAELTTGAKLTNYYVSWVDRNFQVTAGTFYDQFGSGLLFRAWEDRPLGLNNALMGARFAYNYKNIIAVKALWGMPRMGMEFTKTQIRGADLSFSISELAQWANSSLSIEGSILSRYEAISNDLDQEGGKSNNEGFSGRFNLEKGGFSLKAEYVDAGRKYFQNTEMGEGIPLFLKKNGNAQLLELGYNANGLGINLTGRRLEWMQSQITASGTYVNSSANMMNYIPAVCTQYTYLLTNLHPYSPQIGDPTFANSGEIGGQFDIFYSFKRGSALGGKRGLKLHANFSSYYTLHKEGSFQARNLLYRDLSIDLEKQFSKRFKGQFLYSLQEQSPTYGTTSETRLQNIFVVEMQYKFTTNFSTRLELQYLATQEDEKDWMAALIEFNIAPAWSIFGSDMYNHGNPGKKLHFYNAGISYAKSRTRIALSYGRFKSGYLCSGGVCRVISAYTGANLQFTTSF